MRTPPARRPKPGTAEWAAYWNRQKADAQAITTATIAGRTYPRVPYGNEAPVCGPTCRDCGVQRGELHVPTCAIERCACCGVGQAIGCSCEDAPSPGGSLQ